MTQVPAVSSAEPGPEPDASRVLTVVGDSGSPRAARSPHLGLWGSAWLGQAHAGWGDPQRPPPRASSSPLGMDPYDRHIAPRGLQLAPGDGPLPQDDYRQGSAALQAPR